MQDQDVVRSVSIFGDLTENESLEFLQSATRQRLESGAVLVREGDPSDGIFIVLSGRFCVYMGYSRTVRFSRATFPAMCRKSGAAGGCHLNPYGHGDGA
jgi:CRP-like cAMP-binding protein